MFSRCLTTRVTGYDQPPLQIMQMLYCFVNNVHVDYADFLLEGLHYSLEHPSTLIPYPRFTKIIVIHYMTAFPEISQRVCSKYHNLEDDEMVKSIFNFRKNKARVGMKIPSWMITDEIKLMENYQMHRITSSPRTPNPDMDEGESSVPRKSTVIRLRIPPRRSTRLTPPTADEADDLILQDIIQLSITEQKSHDDLEAKQNEEKVKEQLMAKEIEKLVEGTENIGNYEVNNSISNSQNDPGTRLEPIYNKESLEVEKTSDVSQPVNVIEEKDESAKDDYELKRRKKRNEVEETRNTPPPTPTRSPRIHSTLISSDTEKL
ncbi:hypothetical protein Tco_0598842 [Tanacetum coccineum]